MERRQRRIDPVVTVDLVVRIVELLSAGIDVESMEDYLSRDTNIDVRAVRKLVNDVHSARESVREKKSLPLALSAESILEDCNHTSIQVLPNKN